MKFHPSWKFYLNIILCLTNLWMFIQSGNKISFWISAFCCLCSIPIWKSEKFLFDITQKEQAIKKAFEDKKKEEDVNF